MSDETYTARLTAARKAADAPRAPTLEVVKRALVKATQRINKLETENARLRAEAAHPRVYLDACGVVARVPLPQGDVPVTASFSTSSSLTMRVEMTTDTAPSEVEPTGRETAKVDLSGTGPLSGLTMDDLEAEHARCNAGGWHAEAERVRAEIDRRIQAAQGAAG